ncbi:serine/threonine-protein kinase [Brasilonema octagenarum]|jgi:serine/threonine-protein kinase|uniref:serine/threonine-protein kinase n=1 Tax=Brasilonema octagenarum TaxID=417105 RepID=UPI002006DE3D|nr:serine/threonine-protein kinase [Brasilonema octagenarum]
MSDPNIGRLLGKRYELQEIIGTGAMGRVYRAKDILLGGVPVAVKFLALSTQNQNLRVQERFEQEAKTCAILGQKSIHIVRVMDYGVDENNTPFYVMEYLQGTSLSNIIRHQPPCLPRFLNLVRQICLGLQCAHNGIFVEGKICPIIHRDIKPSNIVVIQDHSFGELVKVLDFGIAKLLHADSSYTDYYLGTLAYSSPEQIDGQELDNRADIYSLGVMMFEMLTGKIPLVASTNSFGAWYKVHHYQQPRSFSEVAPNLQLPQSVKNLVMSCLAKTPSSRPQSINEILQILRSLEQGDAPLARPLSGDRASETLPNIDQAPTVCVLIKTDVDTKLRSEIAFRNGGGTQTHRLTELGSVGVWESEKISFPRFFAPSSSSSHLLSLNSTQYDDNSQAVTLSSGLIQEIVQQACWPSNKPIADIVFPSPLGLNGKELPALWVMLPHLEIQKRLVCKRYNQFLFITSPHPMLLWITLIYNTMHGAKWLTYYLDLKTTFGQKITRLLRQTGYYPILFFTRETPNRCVDVLLSSIASTQRLWLHHWVTMSNKLVSSAEPQFSKTLLKTEYEKIKPHILAKIQAMDTDSSFDLFG